MKKSGKKKGGLARPKAIAEARVPAYIAVAAAENWALKNGLVPPLEISQPKREEYGWACTVIETSGKKRIASVKLDRLGKPSLWELTCPTPWHSK